MFLNVEKETSSSDSKKYTVIKCFQIQMFESKSSYKTMHLNKKRRAFYISIRMLCVIHF